MQRTELDLGRTYIVELPGKVVKLIAQLLHIYLIGFPNNRLARSGIEILREQTSVVDSDPDKHGVYPGQVNAESFIVLSPAVYHNPVK